MTISSLSNKVFIENLLNKKTAKFGVRSAEYASAGDHLHLKVRITSRETFQKFLKSVTSLIARKDRERGRAKAEFSSA